MSADRFTLPVFAKINLALRVRGRREDGYHEIETVFQTITLHDRLTFEPRGDERIELACDAPDVPADEGNLVHRAALALREHFHLRRGASITLEKNIPAQAGLGGGSADAAVALVALAYLWKVAADRAELTRIAALLGADVPFFLTGGTALGTGKGADITPLEDVPPKHLVVVTPGVKVSTADAYKALNAPALTKGLSAANLSVSRAESRFSDSLCESLRNDFEAVIFRLHPEIGRAREALLQAGARGALLSGSGSSVYGVFANKGEAERARERLGSETGWRVFACATLSRAEYMRALGRCAQPLRRGREM